MNAQDRDEKVPLHGTDQAGKKALMRFLSEFGLPMVPLKVICNDPLRFAYPRIIDKLRQDD